MVKDIGSIYKYNQPKKSTTAFKKPVLSSSADHAISASISTGTSISSQLDNKYIFTDKNKNSTSNTNDTFEKQCVELKCMLQSSRLEDCMKTIGIDLSLCNRSSFEQ